MSRNLTRTFHPRPPGHARHRTGSSCMLAGRSAWLTRVQLGRGCSQVLARTEGGGTS